jgi:hypothetical protein
MLPSLMEPRILYMVSFMPVEDITKLSELGILNTPNLVKISSMPSLEDLS